jgi:hypothetical protein
MKCCSACASIVQRFAGPVEEKSGPGAIFGKYRCFICWKGFDVQVDYPHNLNVRDELGVVQKVRAEIGVVVECPLCEQQKDEAAGKATKANIVFHNCGRPN